MHHFQQIVYYTYLLIKFLFKSVLKEGYEEHILKFTSRLFQSFTPYIDIHFALRVVLANVT